MPPGALDPLREEAKSLSVCPSPLSGDQLRSRASHGGQAVSGPCSVLEDSSKLKKMKKEQKRKDVRKEARKGEGREGRR